MSGELLRSLAVSGQADRMKALLVGGANPCSLDDAGLTALHFAAWNGKFDAVLTLLANPVGSNEDGIKQSCIDMQSSEGWTPLHIAASDGQNSGKVCRWLLLAGADKNILDAEGRTALDLAEEECNQPAINVLRTLDVTREARKAFKKDVLAEHKVVKRRRHKKALAAAADFVPEPLPREAQAPVLALVEEPEPCREDLIPLPHELQMHEHKIYYHAQKHYHDKRSAENLRQVPTPLN
mmetsp:Transcript_3789/g.10908  ORF Transcript_3789/g.10908 Transcript_3789/m.10908 type:complete len:238 (-) Transcript_3789:612-1325(-)